MAGVRPKRGSGEAFLRKPSSLTRPVGVFFERAGIDGHQEMSVWGVEWIGPSVYTRRRRKQIVSSTFDGERKSLLVKI